MSIPKAPAFSIDEYRRRLGVVNRRMAAVRIAVSGERVVADMSPVATGSTRPADKARST